MKQSILILILGAASSLAAQTTLENARTARKVDHFITLQVKSDSVIDYRIDGGLNAKSLESANYFQAGDREMRVYVDFINPLRYRLNTTESAYDDELMKGVVQYISNAIQFVQSISPSAAAKQALEASGNNQPLTLEFITNDPDVLELFYYIQDFDNDYFFNNRAVLDSLNHLDPNKVYVQSETLIQNIFQRLWMIERAAQIATAEADNQKSFSDIEDALNKLAKQIASLGSFIDAMRPAAQNDLTKKLKFVRITLKYEEIKAKLMAYEDKLISIKAKYIKTEALFKDTRIDVAANQIRLNTLRDINSKKRREIRLTLEKAVFNTQDFSLSYASGINFVLHVRRYQRIIPSVSTGLFYSSLAFNRFGTATNAAGQTIVSAAEPNDNPVLSAAHLNLFFNSSRDIVWLGQVGVGPSKEKPVFLLGGGAYYKGFQLSLGAIWTWQPRLNSLEIGDVVTGTSDIENDIRFKFDAKPRFYIGLSINLTD